MWVVIELEEFVIERVGLFMVNSLILLLVVY